jgi:hypothetical protein
MKSFKEYYYGDKIKEDEMEGHVEFFMGMRISRKVTSGEPEEKRSLGDIGVNERTISKCITDGVRV